MNYKVYLKKRAVLKHHTNCNIYVGKHYSRCRLPHRLKPWFFNYQGKQYNVMPFYRVFVQYRIFQLLSAFRLNSLIPLSSCLLDFA